MKIDPHKHKEKYLRWKEKTKEGIPNITRGNSDIIKQFLNDMERGMNVAKGSKKGARSFIRLNTLRDRLIYLSKNFELRLSLDLLNKVNEEQLHTFFTEMRNGQIRRKDGEEYKSVADYVKTFKAFWHWYIKMQKKEGKETDESILLANGIKINKEQQKYSQIQPKNCLKCKTKNEATNRFCKICGMPLNEEDAQNIIIAEVEKTTNNNNNKINEIMNSLLKDPQILELIRKKISGEHDQKV